MKKFLSVFMILSLFTAVTAKAQTDSSVVPAAPASVAPAAETTTTGTADSTTATDTAAPATTTGTAPSNPAESTTSPAAAAAPTTANVTSADANTAAKPVENDLENTLYLDLKDGRVVIKLLPEVAPNHVKRIKELVRQGFYDGVPFHRVIEGFMAQTGDPTGTGTGGSGQKLDAEFNSEKHVRGTVAMARASDPNSADSQFYIMFDEAPHLDGNYTVFGKVVEGMEFVDKIKKGTGPNGMVSEPDKIIKLRVATDIKDGDAAKPAADAPSSTAPATEAPKQ